MLDFDLWWRSYRPTGSPRHNSGPCIGDTPRMFETFDDDLQDVLAANERAPGTVWTLIEGDDGEQYIVNGYHDVNRLGYFITEVARVDESVFFEILVG